MKSIFSTACIESRLQNKCAPSAFTGSVGVPQQFISSVQERKRAGSLHYFCSYVALYIHPQVILKKIKRRGSAHLELLISSVANFPIYPLFLKLQAGINPEAETFLPNSHEPPELVVYQATNEVYAPGLRTYFGLILPDGR